jgi:hypothetical protein
MNYYDNPAMSQSKLKDLKKSPKHFWAKHINPDREPQEETEAMRFGKAFHMYLLEPQKFMTSYVVAPNIDKRTKIGKEIHAVFMANSEGKYVISENDIKTIKCMRDSILNKKSSRILFNGGLAEHELYWRDRETGINCKAKPDYHFKPCELFPNGAIIDPKTTGSANAEEFSKSIYNFGYHNQAAWYCDAYKEEYGTDIDPIFINVPIEKETPYECGFYVADEIMIKMGRKENRRLLNLYNECLNTGKWDGYPDKIEYISLPPWIINKFNFEEQVA